MISGEDNFMQKVDILGDKITDFSSVLLYVPSIDELVVVRAADGEGLSDEDFAEGYIDSVSYDRYNTQWELIDGGFQMFSCTIEETYDNFGELLPEIISFIYDDTVKGVVYIGKADREV